MINDLTDGQLCISTHTVVSVKETNTLIGQSSCQSILTTNQWPRDRGIERVISFNRGMQATWHIYVLIGLLLYNIISWSAGMLDSDCLLGACNTV